MLDVFSDSWAKTSEVSIGDTLKADPALTMFDPEKPIPVYKGTAGLFVPANTGTFLLEAFVSEDKTKYIGFTHVTRKR